MIEKIKHNLNQVFKRFQDQPMKQKGMLLGSIAFVIITAIVLIMFFTRPNLVPLYSDLSPQEAGQIKESLDAKGVASQLSDGGKVISVPKEAVDRLKVELASEGIPKSGSIDYSFFGENKGFGMTDNEFNVVEKEATQTEIEKLIKSMEGVNEATVMITTADKGIWVSDDKQLSSASVVLTLEPGYKLDDGQIKSLYHLVSKSVPDLPTENIVISDQYFNTFHLDEGSSNSDMTAYEEQRKIKRDIEQDLQTRVQQMLGILVGPNKIVAAVTADIDFTKEQREEKLVEPADPQKMEGIKISAEKVKETFSGDNAKAGGVDGTGESDIPTYQGSGNGSGDYEKVEDRINYEVNRIKKEVVKSPYEIQDLGIQVMVEPPKPNDMSSLPQGTLKDIQQMLSNIVQTSISKGTSQNLSKQQISDKIFVSAMPFQGKAAETAKSKGSIPMWIYIACGILLVVIIVLIFLLLRKKKDEEEERDELPFENDMIHIPDVNASIETEGAVRKEQLEKMAKEKPEEFAKLLRTWLSEE